MVFVLIFSLTLLLAVLLSALAERSVLSTALIFLIAGWLAGSGGFDLLHLHPQTPGVELLVDLAMFSVLFTDGMRVNVTRLRQGWWLPARALLLGLPITLLLTAIPAHLLLQLPWTECFLLGAVLSPTDPVLAAAIVGREDVPRRVRGLLNVESGMNDGLALPIVIVLLAVVNGAAVHSGEIVIEIAAGVGLGLAVPWIAVRLESWRWFAASAPYQPLNAFAIGLMVLSLASLTRANLFLAGFTAGITLGAIGADFRDAFAPFGELIAELFKLVALMVVGIIFPPTLLLHTPLAEWLFVLLVLVAARSLALELSLLRTPLDWRERLTVSWFGPKGFASVLFGLLILRGGSPHAVRLFRVVALVVTVSVIAHSSTDVPFARWFRRMQESKGREEGGERRERNPEPG